MVVGTGRDANDTELVVVRVSDTGPDLTPDEQERIFERFHRVVDGSSHRPSGDHCSGGSGLGLGICKAIVEAHGGRIRVESEGTAATGATVLGSHFVIELLALAPGR